MEFDLNFLEGGTGENFPFVMFGTGINHSRIDEVFEFN
jgi:hypothetical protein